MTWREYIDSLIYCFGCGRFGRPVRGKLPTGWYALHGNGCRARLTVCGESCRQRVLEAMQCGPVDAPLQQGAPPMMPSDVYQEMMSEVSDGMMERLRDRKMSEKRIAFGKLVESLRIMRGISCLDLGTALFGEDLGLSEATRFDMVRKLERGAIPPSKLMIDDITKLFDLRDDDVTALMEAATAWHRSLWMDTQSVVLDGGEMRMASLVPSASQLHVMRDEVTRLVEDLHLIQERAMNSMKRAQATLEDLDGGLSLTPKNMPEDYPLGSPDFNPNPCSRCGGTGVDPDVEEVENIKAWELRCRDCEGTGQRIERFMIGHVYSSTRGELVRPLARVETTAYGVSTVIAESTISREFRPMADGVEHSRGWREIPLAKWFEHWLRSNPNDAELQAAWERSTRADAKESDDDDSADVES